MELNKPTILLIGDHPYCYTGCGNMIRALLERIDHNAFNVIVYGIGNNPDPKHYSKNLPYRIIPSKGMYGESQLFEHLSYVIQSIPMHVLMFVGVDCWTFSSIYDKLFDYQNKAKFSTIGLFPYDLPYFREDWAYLFNRFDFPCVYSQYGYDALKAEVEDLQYFHPPLADSNLYHTLSVELRKKVREEMNVDEDVFLFGYVGTNQFRKDPQRLLKAFYEVKQKINSALYLHMEFDGVFNIDDLSHHFEFSRGEIYAKKQGAKYGVDQMVKAYNAMDCLVNCSLQEGLSYTPLEAMLCGTPVIATDTTAQTEVVKDAGLLVPCKELAYIPVMGSRGPFMSFSKAPIVENIVHSMLKVAQDGTMRKEMREKGLKKAAEWVNQTSDINQLLNQATIHSVEKLRVSRSSFPRKPDILFAQHSSAGDVLMTTQCFKGIKEKNPNKKLVYMTQKQYQDIVTGNPYIDEIIDWDEDLIRNYEVVYNPHGDHILHGGFNSLDVALHEMYPYFCKVKADEMYISLSDPYLDLEKDQPILVVHTTGGHPFYRTYSKMDLALKQFKDKYFIVQIGGKEDYVCRSAHLDLRGQLTFRQTAWVMNRASLVVAVDSFPMHLSGALGVDLIAIFGPAPARVTGPRMQENEYGTKPVLITLEPDKLATCRSLTNCWGRYVTCKTPCINSISPFTLAKAIEHIEFMKEGEKLSIVGNDTSIL